MPTVFRGAPNFLITLPITGQFLALAAPRDPSNPSGNRSNRPSPSESLRQHVAPSRLRDSASGRIAAVCASGRAAATTA
jgi:hypothetical protein